jgi:hypothetical protein
MKSGAAGVLREDEQVFGTRRSMYFKNRKGGEKKERLVRSMVILSQGL